MAKNGILLSRKLNKKQITQKKMSISEYYPNGNNNLLRNIDFYIHRLSLNIAFEFGQKERSKSRGE